MANLPIGTGWRGLRLRSLDPTLTSLAHSGRVFRRKPAGHHQRWAFSVQWPNLTRDQAAEILAFLDSQRGSFGVFEVVLPVEGTPRGVLGGVPVVRDRENLLLRSEAFGTAPWGVENATISANQIANPVDGAVTADKLVEDSSAGIYHRVRQGYVGGFAAGVAACSIYLKAAERTEANVFLYDVAVPGAIISAYVNLSTGVITNLSGKGTTKAATATAMTDGWWLLQMACGVAATASANLYISLGAGGITNYNGDGSSGAYVFGAQLETAATPGPYLPTTDAAITAQSSSGSTLYTDGWTPNASGVLLQRDLLRLAGHNKAYRLTADADADAWGNAALSIYPPLVATPADNEALTVSSVPIRCAIDGDPKEVGFAPPDRYTVECDLVEDWS